MKRLALGVVFATLLAACQAPPRDAPRVATPPRDPPRVATPPRDPPRVATPPRDPPRVVTPPRDTPHRATPHVDPDELERIAYKVVREDKTPLAYVVYRSSRPKPRFYDPDGYRIFVQGYWERYWEFHLRRAQRNKRTTIVADEYMAEDLSKAQKAPPSHVEAGNKLPSLQDALYPNAKLRRDYKRSCIETLGKILQLAEEGDLAYVPVLVRAEIKKVIDSDDYHDLCRAMNAVIAFGIVAQA